MDKDKNNPFAFLFLIPDHRRGNHLLYPIDYLLLVALCTLLSGSTSWRSMELYAKRYEKDLKKLYLRLTETTIKQYTPSHDTFNAAFRGLNPQTFYDAFVQWVTCVYDVLGQHISIDGKTMRGVKKMRPDDDCHTVTAYLSGIRVALDQVFISKKSNEINAIKELLDRMDIEGATITIDAIGTQADIVEHICDKGGDYILNVKENQKGTLLEVEDHFAKFYAKEIVKRQSTDAEHGRVEVRCLESFIDPARVDDLEQTRSLKKWTGLRSLHKLTRSRCNKKTGETSTEISYYISSLTDPDKVFELIRAHWAVENNLHYALDVFMGEDQSLKRSGNVAKNFNVVSKVALFILEKMKAKSGLSFPLQKQLNATYKPSQLLKFRL